MQCLQLSFVEPRTSDGRWDLPSTKKYDLPRLAPTQTPSSPTLIVVFPRFVDVTVPLRILENVEDCFVRVRWRNGMLFFVDLHVELGSRSGRNQSPHEPPPTDPEKALRSQTEVPLEESSLRLLPLRVGHGKPNQAGVQMARYYSSRTPINTLEKDAGPGMLTLVSLSQPKTLRQQFRDRHLLGTGLAAKQNQSIRAEFEDDLAAGAAWGAGTIVFSGDGDSLDPHAASFGCDRGENSVSFGADGQAVRGVLHVASANKEHRARSGWSILP